MVRERTGGSVREEGIGGIEVMYFGQAINSLYFLIWLSSGAVHMQGITKGCLGSDCNDAANACEALGADKNGAKLYQISEESIGECDFGCQHGVDVYEVSCRTETHVEQTTIAVPLEVSDFTSIQISCMTRTGESK